MSNTSKKLSKTNAKPSNPNSETSTKMYLYTFGSFVLGILSGIVLMSLINNNLTSNTGNNVVTTYEYESEILTGDKADKAIADITKYADLVSSKNAYTQVMTSDTKYMCYIYNSNKEVYVESSDNSYSEVYLNDGNSFGFSSADKAITKGTNVDILTMIRNAANAVGKVKGVTLYDMDLSYLGSEVKVNKGDHEYRIDLKGEEAVKALYSSAGEEFANNMVKALKEDLDNWEPHIIMLCYINENIEKSYFSALYVIDNKEYANWIFEGFIEIGEWKLSDSWYQYNIENDKNGEEGIKLLEELTKTISQLIEKYADENNLNLGTDSNKTDSTNTETNSESTETNK